MLSNILVVAAHPDDEMLGCGGAIAHFSAQGLPVNVIIFLADGVSARNENDKNRLQRCHMEARTVADCSGLSSIEFEVFPDNQLDTVPLLSIVKKIETAIAKYRPDTILTHHAGDVNIDHQKVHQAVITACRPQPNHPVKTLLFFEVPSSTEWQPRGSVPAFLPNWFIDISAALLTKLEAYNE